MRILFFLAVTFLFCAGCGRNAPASSGDTADNPSVANYAGEADIEFRTTRYDFGNVSHGEKLVYTFVYRNTGDVPLIIYSARADCGCTVPEFDPRPLEPGKEGRLKVVFDTQGFSGRQVKTIHLVTNTSNSMTTLALRAMIE